MSNPDPLSVGSTWVSRRKQGPIHRLRIRKVSQASVEAECLGPSQNNKRKVLVRTSIFLTTYRPA